MPRRISARVAAIAAPDDSRGTASIAPSRIGASASSSEWAIIGMRTPARGRGLPAVRTETS